MEPEEKIRQHRQRNRRASTSGGWCNWTVASTKAGMTRTSRLPDEPGGRCHLATLVSHGRAGNQSGRPWLLRAWIEKYGVPRARYTDWKTCTCATHGQGATARKAQPDAVGRIASGSYQNHRAGSPDAKGRVERNHGTIRPAGEKRGARRSHARSGDPYWSRNCDITTALRQ